MEIIKIENLSFDYNGTAILKNVSFSIGKGDFVGVTGPNGTGKSTLLKLILNLLKPSTGKITISTQGNNGISYVAQKASAFNGDFPATVSEVVSLGLYQRNSFFKPYGKGQKQAVADALEKVSMQDYASRRIGRLSGGQQQRVFIARALVKNPDIIILDEPTAGIDITTAGSICCLLGELNKKYGITVIMVTHDMPSILNHSTKIINFNRAGAAELLLPEHYNSLLSHTH